MALWPIGTTDRGGVEMKTQKIISNILNSNEGQGILEVVLVLPFLFTFVILLYKMNMASQMAINNAQIARSQMFQLTANSPEYPRLEFRFKDLGAKWIHEEGHARLVMGVSDKPANSNEEVAEIEPIPQIQPVGRRGSTVKGSSDSGEVSLRNEVRVRNTVAICTQFNSATSGGKRLDLTPAIMAQLGSARWPFGGNTVCKYETTE